MIEAITLAALETGTEVLREATASMLSEGLIELGQELSSSTELMEHGRAYEIGGDFDSILSALGVEVESVGVERAELVPLKDSLGEVQHMLSLEEAAHYEQIGLEPVRVNDKECLIRSDIDWTQKDGCGQTNLERCKRGGAPIDKNGRPIELHHVQQKSDGMLAELTFEEHRSAGIDKMLHPNKVSEIDRLDFNKVKSEHWKTRALEQNI